METKEEEEVQISKQNEKRQKNVVTEKAKGKGKKIVPQKLQSLEKGGNTKD